MSWSWHAQGTFLLKATISFTSTHLCTRGLMLNNTHIGIVGTRTWNVQLMLIHGCTLRSEFHWYLRTTLANLILFIILTRPRNIVILIRYNPSFISLWSSETDLSAIYRSMIYGVLAGTRNFSCTFYKAPNGSLFSSKTHSSTSIRIKIVGWTAHIILSRTWHTILLRLFHQWRSLSSKCICNCFRNSSHWLILAWPWVCHLLRLGWSKSTKLSFHTNTVLWTTSNSLNHIEFLNNHTSIVWYWPGPGTSNLYLEPALVPLPILKLF